MRRQLLAMSRNRLLAIIKWRGTHSSSPIRPPKKGLNREIVIILFSFLFRLSWETSNLENYHEFEVSRDDGGGEVHVVRGSVQARGPTADVGRRHDTVKRACCALLATHSHKVPPTSPTPTTSPHRPPSIDPLNTFNIPSRHLLVSL